MAFRQATGREDCNRCHQTPDLGAPVWEGVLTRAVWCEGCALDTLGQSVNGPVPVHVLAVPKRITVASILARYPKLGRALVTAERDHRKRQGNDIENPF